jgi:hypothetical protein
MPAWCLTNTLCVLEAAAIGVRLRAVFEQHEDVEKPFGLIHWQR